MLVVIINIKYKYRFAFFLVCLFFSVIKYSGDYSNIYTYLFRRKESMLILE